MTCSNTFYPSPRHISLQTCCCGDSASEAEGSAASSNKTKYHISESRIEVWFEHPLVTLSQKYINKSKKISRYINNHITSFQVIKLDQAERWMTSKLQVWLMSFLFTVHEKHTWLCWDISLDLWSVCSSASQSNRCIQCIISFIHWLIMSFFPEGAL